MPWPYAVYAMGRTEEYAMAWPVPCALVLRPAVQGCSMYSQEPALQRQRVRRRSQRCSDGDKWWQAEACFEDRKQVIRLQLCVLDVFQ